MWGGGGLGLAYLRPQHRDGGRHRMGVQRLQVPSEWPAWVKESDLYLKGNWKSRGRAWAAPPGGVPFKGPLGSGVDQRLKRMEAQGATGRF